MSPPSPSLPLLVLSPHNPAPLGIHRAAARALLRVSLLSGTCPEVLIVTVIKFNRLFRFDRRRTNRTTGPFSTWTDNRTTVQIGRQISHRSDLFTQGLIVINGSFLEGSGLRDCGSRVVAYSTTDGMVTRVANIDCTKVGTCGETLGADLYFSLSEAAHPPPH